jgi:hypothetical protein
MAGSIEEQGINARYRLTIHSDLYPLHDESPVNPAEFRAEPSRQRGRAAILESIASREDHSGSVSSVGGVTWSRNDSLDGSECVSPANNDLVHI